MENINDGITPLFQEAMATADVIEASIVKRYQQPRPQWEARTDSIVLLQSRLFVTRLALTKPFAQSEDQIIERSNIRRYNRILNQSVRGNWEPIRRFFQRESREDLDQTRDLDDIAQKRELSISSRAWIMLANSI